MTIYEVSIYEVSIPNPNDAPAALASLIESGFDAERIEVPVPGAVALIKVAVTGRDRGKFCGWLQTVAGPLGGEVFETGITGPMQAEIMFLDADDVGAGITALRDRGCHVELLLTRDPCRHDPCGTSAIWLRVTVAHCDEELFDWIQGIVEPLGGDVLEADLPRRQPSPTAAMK